MPVVAMELHKTSLECLVLLISTDFYFFKLFFNSYFILHITFGIRLEVQFVKLLDEL